jgi:hypothetical protein
VRLEPWGVGDLALLEKCLGDPAMMQHLGGPESPEMMQCNDWRLDLLAS